MVENKIQTEVFLELIFSTFGDLDEQVILQKSIPVYMRKLNCILAGVLKKNGDTFSEKIIMPVVAGKTSEWVELKEHFTLDTPKENDHCSSVFKNNFHYYAFTLDGYGILILGRKKPFDEAFANELEPIANHFGQVLVQAYEKEQRMKAELALLENQKLFSSFIHHSPIYAFIKDVKYNESRVLFASENYIDMIGIPGSKMNGKTMDELFPQEAANKFTKDDWVVVSSGKVLDIQEELNGRSYNTIKFPIILEDKTLLAGYTIDLTEQQLAQAALKESEVSYKRLFNRVSDAIYVLDHNGCFLDVNDTASAMYGYSKSYLIGKSPADVSPEGRNDLEATKKHIVKAFKGTPCKFEFWGQRKNGDVFLKEVRLTKGVYFGQEVVYALANDITDRKLAEEALIEAKEKAEESDRLKSAFLANMSHEIRTPMNGILGFADLLKEPHLSGEEQQKYIRIIEESGTRMLSIINDIISISKVESGQMDVVISETNLNEQVDYIYTFFKPEAKKKGIDFSLSTDVEDQDFMILTDREKVYAILTNLIKNAIKFTEDGSIKFGYVLKKDVMEFFVKDTGMGIRKDQQSIIFERFRQGSESLTRNYEGAGLGLSITKAYVSMLGGNIWVEDNKQDGRGSVFYFTLPNKQGHNKSESSTDPGESASEFEVSKKLKILIVEDDEESELFLEIVLKHLCKEIIKVNDGVLAVEKCRSNPDIDLVLMDIKMPEMDGYTATRSIRSFNKDVIIIAQTAFGLAGDREKSIDAGCNDYISKPISRDGLMHIIQKYFEV